MPNKKHYIITSITLGAIAAVSAALIGLTNLVTRDKIAENERNKINNGINEIFGDGSEIKEEKKIDQYNLSVSHTYLSDTYVVNEKNTDNILGYAFLTSGSNSYGKISLIIGFNKTDLNFKGLSIVVNEQTYATTLVDEYINPLNEGAKKLDDVSCGATYGAKLVRDMINEASEAAKEIWE